MSKAVKAVGNVVKGAVNIVKGVVKAAVNVVKAVVNMVVQPFMGLLGAPTDVPDANSEANRQQGILIQQQGGGAVAIPVVYGFRKMAGIVTYCETGATNNKYLWVAYTFSEGPVNALFEVWLNDEILNSAYVPRLNSGQTVDITDGKYSGRVSMRWSPGVYFADPVNSPLGTQLKAGLFAEAPNYKTSMVHNGLATLFVRYEYKQTIDSTGTDTNPFNSGSIPTIHVTLQGRRVAPIVYNSGQTNAQNAATNAALLGSADERYSTNPAEILLDYLRNNRYGKGLKSTDIDWKSFNIAKNKLNTQVQYVNKSANLTGPILTTNFVLDTNQTLMSNIKTLLAGARAYMPYVQGTYKLKIEDAGNETSITSGSAYISGAAMTLWTARDPSVIAYNEYDIMGDIVYTGIERSAKYNQVIVTWVDPDQKWANQQAVYPTTEAERLNYQTIDGGRENKLDVTFPTITNYAMAMDMARLLFYKSRYQDAVTVKVASQAFDLEPGDIINVQGRIMDLAFTPWRIISIKYNDDYTFELGCVRCPDFIYPYTKANEQDYIAALYVPKGASIYYQKEITQYGYRPPARGKFADPIGTTLNPIPPDPDGTYGGGVGGQDPTNTINYGDGSNDTPSGLPYQKPMSDIINITNLKYVTQNNLVYAELTVKSPDHPMFNGFDCYYKINSPAVSYQSRYFNEVVAPNTTYKVTLGPLAAVGQTTAYTYVAEFRVRYTSEQRSSQFFRITLNPVSQIDNNTNPSETAQFVSAAWDNPETATPAAKDSVISRLEGTLVPTGVPRTLSIRLTQEVVKQTPNFDVQGVNIYHKLSSETTWAKTSITFGVGYFAGAQTSFTFPGNIGSYNDGANSYNFIFVLTYANGVESSRYTPFNMNVQSATTSYDPFYGYSNLDISWKEGVVPVVINTAVPGDMKLGISSSGAGLDYVSGGYRFFLDPPATSRNSWAGVRFYYRALATGQTYTIKEFKYPGVNINDLIGPLTLSGMNYNTQYEIVIVPLVTGNPITEATYSLYGKGYIPSSSGDPNYSSTGQYKQVFQFQSVATSTAFARINQPFVEATPVVGVTGLTQVTVPLNPTSTTSQVNSYFALTFNVNSAFTGFQKLNIYRRDRYSMINGTDVGATLQSKYYGAGQWEKISQSGSAGNSYTVNLRPPTAFNWFDAYYQVPGYSGRSLKFSYSYQPAGLAPVVYLGGSGTRAGCIELLLIAETIGAVESSKAILLQIPVTGRGVGTFDLLSGVNGIVPKTIDWDSSSDPNAAGIRSTDFENGYLRRKTEAIAPLTTSQITYNGNYVTTGSYQSNYPLNSSYPSATPTIV